MTPTKTRQDTKSELLEAGMSIMVTKGYNATGILDVLQSVGVPKGSFYHYFESKEDFALQIIDYFDLLMAEKLERLLGDTQKSPRQRLMDYCEEGRSNVEAGQCKKGCLIGKLSQEMAEQNEVLRLKLEQVLSRWRNCFADCIAAGQKLGEISCRHDSRQLAEFFLSGWEGAVMRSKTERTTEPQRVFIKLMFEEMLKP